MNTKKFLSNITGWKKYFLVYLALLAISHLVIWGLEKNPIKKNDGPQNEMMLNVVLEDYSQSKKEFKIEYEDIYTGSEENPPAILLLPGGPEGPEVFEDFKWKLSSQYRVIIPHLPGFGSSNDDLPDYSFKALSIYANQFLKKLELSNLHILGYGLGGASAIYLAHNYPEKVQSLSLISSIGVQELELLGSYRLNHAVHGIQLSAVWLLHNVVPHFGLFNAFEIDVSYAKSHYESDQRPLRSHLKQYKKPMLIVHGADDPLVPLAAANEHYRIVPQSELKVYQNADHDLIKTHSDSVSRTVEKFLATVEAGKAETASTASESRIAKAEKPFSNVDFAKFKGASLLIIMLIIVLGTFISEDLTCIGAGLLAARGLIGFWEATLACFTGIFIGDVGLYLIGRFFGRRAVKKAPFKWFLCEKDLKRSAQWFEVKGPAIIIATRFLPGSRMPTYFSAGVIQAGFWMFTFYFLLAAVVWTPLLVGISKFLGNELLHYFVLYQGYAIWVFLGAVVFLIMIVKVVIPVFSYKGRRLLVSRYRRLTRWEYWPPVILYAPVFCYLFYLGIKNRCLTLFTAANPAFPDGGFVGESKTDILNLFDKQYIANFCRISSALKNRDKIRKAEEFMEERGITFPIVLKPDIGQRGKGVEIIRDRQAMKDYLMENSGDVIIQEFIEGKEFGVFYYRMPDELQGNIFSITIKELLHVQGDGKKTVQELILDDDQAVSLAKFHLRRNQDRLYNVPEKGIGIPLVEIGTHARGAIFRDGEELISDALVEKMNEICNPVLGFYFGRFDIKAPTAQDLVAGNDLKIIEINGVTSESTNIYDKKYSFLDAQKILFNQWKLAFLIGRKNRENGTEASVLFPFLKRTISGLLR